MRRGIVGVGVIALVATGLTALPPAAAQSAPGARVAPAEESVQSVTPGPNPSISETCGLDATLILDASGSINSAHAVNTVRNASYDLLAALKDTNSSLRITQFGTFSGLLSSRVPVNATTTGTGGQLSKAVANYYSPPPQRPAGVTIYNGNRVDNNALTWTNWEDGIKGIDNPELAIYMTDGDPTAYNVSSTRTNVNTSSTGTALDNAITQANALKVNGTRMLVVGVGSGLTSTSSQDRLKKISGPLLEKNAAALANKTINQVDAVAFSDFAALGTFLRSVVTSLCGNSVTVQKLAQTSSGADYVPTTGWDVTVQPTVSGGFKWVDPVGADNTPQTRPTSGAQGTAAFQWKPKVASQKATVQVSESVKTGYTSNRWSCEIKTASGSSTTVSGNLTQPSFSFEMNPSDVATCKLYNDFNYQPAITITKVAADDPVRGNGVGWNEEYSFTVKNTGNAALTVTKPVDPQCSSITGPTGPGAATGKLQPGVSWTYTCAAKIGPVATVTTALAHSNRVTVAGIPPKGAPVSAYADESVGVKTPAISLDKTAKQTQGGDPIPDGGLVPAGARVTYVYTVTNTGNDTLQNVAPRDDKCSPLNRVTGSGSTLAPGAFWVYECATRINPPSSVSSVTNTADVSALWSNPQNLPQNNGPVTDTDQMTINVTRAANLRIIKSTNPGEVDEDFPFTVAGQGVPSGDTAFNLNTSSQVPTPASRNIALDGPNPAPGSVYTITEGAATGFDLTKIECVDAQGVPTGTPSLLNRRVQVTMTPGADVTCTFTNEKLPSLTIKKQVVVAQGQTGEDQRFGFTTTGLPGPFDLGNDEDEPFLDLAAGVPLSVTETGVTGWTLTSLSCTGTGSDALTVDKVNRQVSGSLDYGDDVVCQYVNTKDPSPPALLTVVKQVDPTVDAPAFSYTFTSIPADPAVVTPFTLDPNLSGTAARDFTLNPPEDGGGVYTITELPTSEWDNTGLSCVKNGSPAGPFGGSKVDLQLDPGDRATCTYTNAPKAQLTIVKHESVASGQVGGLDYTFDSTNLGQSPFFLKDKESKNFPYLTAGTDIGVEEQDPGAAWTTTVDCTGPGASHYTVTGREVSGTTQSGDDVTCVYTNTKKESGKAVLTVTKQVDPSDDSPEFDYTFTANPSDPGVEPFTLDPGPLGTDSRAFTLSPQEVGLGGTEYTIEEQPSTDFEFTSLDCTINGTTAGTITSAEAVLTLVPDDVAECTYVNTEKAQFTVAKQVVVGTGQSGADTRFDFTATGLSKASFEMGDGDIEPFTNLTTGTAISVTEAGLTDWNVTVTCSGVGSEHYTVVGSVVSGTTQAGDDVTCTYVNTKEPLAPAVLYVYKATDPSNEPPTTLFDFNASGIGLNEVGVPGSLDFSLGNGGFRRLTVHPVEAGNTYTVREEPRAGWHRQIIICWVSGSSDPITVDPDATGEILVPLSPGHAGVCVFVNRKDASLTVIKEAPEDPSLSFDFKWSGPAGAVMPTSPFQLLDGESETAPGLEPGKYDVQEFDLPTDWYLDGPDGEHPLCVGGERSVDPTPALGATIDLLAGEDVVCTFANFFDYNPAITVVKEPDREVVLQGKQVVYTYTVKNTGNVALEPVNSPETALTDDKCQNVSLESGVSPLAVGATWTYRCTSTLTEETTNKATATVKDPLDPPGELKATDTATVDVLIPKLDLVKTVDKPFIYPNTKVTYTYVATNTGTAPFEAPQGATDRSGWISDNKCSPVKYVSGDTGDDSIMGVGESWTYTCDSTLTNSTQNTGTFKATPFAGSEPDKQTGSQMEATATAEVEVITKDITVTKTPSAPGGVFQGGVLLVPVGAEVTYTYEVTSGTATTPMQVADVTDNTCSPVEYQSGDDGSGFVDPGETWLYTCKDTFAGVKTVTNTVVVTALEPILGGIATDTDQATVSSYQGSIAINKSPSADLVPKGTTVTYTYRVTNDGTVDLTDVKATDDQCSPLTYKSGDDGDGIMKPGDEWSYQCVTALQEDVTNIADATGTTPSGGRVTDATSVTVLVIGGRLNPVIAVTKSPSATSVQRGDQVTYTYDVTNAGTMPLTNIRVSDDKCGPVTYVKGDDNGDGLLTSSASGEGYPDETWVYMCTTAINKDTTNTVTALGSPWDAGQVVGTDVSATAQATVKVTAKPPLPIDVDPVKKCKGDTCTLVKKAKTNKYGKLNYRARCRPVKASASGEASFCRTTVTQKGAVKVKVFGYRKVKVTVWIVATPKPKYRSQWAANTWKRTWIIRP